MRLWFAVLLLGLLAGFALGEESVNLTFADAGAKIAWIQTGFPSTQPTSPSKVQGASINLLVTSKDPDTRVFIQNQDDLTVATRKLSSIKDGSWDVKPSDFDGVSEVRVSVEHDGKPVAAASVDLKDGYRSQPQTQILDSSTKGVVSFYSIKSGTVSATVHFRSNGVTASPVTQSFEVKPSKSPTILKIALADPVETVGAAAVDAAPQGSATGSTPDEAASQPVTVKDVAAPGHKEVQSNPFGSLLVIVVVLGLVLAGGYYVMQFMKNNPEKTASTLEQLGVQIPKPGDAPLADGVPNVAMPATTAPEPIQKIILDPVAPIAAAAPISVAPASPAFSGPITNPRLVAMSGDAIPISDQGFVVGRDAGLGLSLIGESTVSRRHAEIQRLGDGFVVKDLGSTNGTYVNGAKLQGEQTLKPGDEVRFGAVAFRFEG